MHRANASEASERYGGSLIGQALGDALGFPVEGYPPETCAAYVDEVLRPRNLKRAVRSPFRFDQYTDYWDAICTAIAVGGDFDTTAAMSGAIGRGDGWARWIAVGNCAAGA